MKTKLKTTFLAAFIILSAQFISAQLIENPTQALIFSLTSFEGTNGTSVVFNPEKKIYYTAIAGNSTYPLETFNEKGKSINVSESGFDVRGMWWDPVAKQLKSNGYDDFGIAKISLSASGIPTSSPFITSEISGQPDANSVAAYDSKSKHLLYYNNGILTKINATSYALVGEVTLQIPTDLEYINTTTVIYTGVAGKEVGLLDYDSKKVYLFDIKTGANTFTINLPANAVTNSAFRFSFANGYVWLFDADYRIWTGYKVM